LKQAVSYNKLHLDSRILYMAND